MTANPSLFAATTWMILLLAAGLAAQAAGELVAGDLLPQLMPELWDSSWLLSTSSILGRMLHTLIGYDDRPSGIHAYAGFNDLYKPERQPGPIAEAGCWSHGRRKFFVLADVAKAPLAAEAVRRIDAIFAIEREINGLSPDQRLAIRKARIAPLVLQFERWMRIERAKLSRHNEVAKATDYMLKRWTVFIRFLDDGNRARYPLGDLFLGEYFSACAA